MIPKERELKKTIAQLCHDIVNEPLLFFSEGDLQGVFYAEMLSLYAKSIKTNCSKGPSKKSFYKTKAVHREYGIEGMSNARMDLVILSKNKVGEIDDPNLQLNGAYIDPVVGFELGTHKISNFQHHLDNDVLKLSCVEKGYVIYFLREEAVSAAKSDRGRNTKIRIEKIQDIVSNKTYPPHIYPLIFIIQIQKTHRIWGKCKFYGKKAGFWTTVNLSEIYDVVLYDIK